MKSPVESGIDVAKKVADAAVGKDGLLTTIYRDRFSPAMKVRGEAAASRLREELERKQQQRRDENIQGHSKNLTSIQDEWTTDGFKDEVAERLALDWCEGVQDVDPDDKELAALWYAALELIEAGGQNNAFLYEVVKSLTPRQAAGLLREPSFPKKTFGIFDQGIAMDAGVEGDLLFDQLKAKRLIVKPRLFNSLVDSIILILQLALFVASIAVVILYVVSGEGGGLFEFVGSLFEQFAPLPMAFLLLVYGAQTGQFFLNWMWKRIARSYKLTDLGQKVAISGRRQLDLLVAKK